MKEYPVEGFSIHQPTDEQAKSRLKRILRKTVLSQNVEEERIEELREEVPFLFQALLRPELFDGALSAINFLKRYDQFDYDISSRVAGSADMLAHNVAPGLERAPIIIEVLSGAYFGLHQAREGDFEDGIQKIEKAIQIAMPGFQDYFEKGSPSRVSDIMFEASTLSKLLSLLHPSLLKKERGWIFRALSDRLYSLVSSHEPFPESVTQPLREKATRGLRYLPKHIAETTARVRYGLVNLFVRLPESLQSDLSNEVMERFGIHCLPEDRGDTDSKAFYEIDSPDSVKRQRVVLIRPIQRLAHLHTLERMRPGIGRYLYQEFGISRIDRYPEKVLVRQYDEREKRRAPYAVLFNARHDHTAAFNSDNDMNVVRSISDQLHELGYSLRIFEVGGALELESVAMLLKERYDPRRASLMILRSHGYRYHLELGAEKGRLHPHILQNKFLKNKGLVTSLQDVLDENAPIVLDSCAAGLYDGIGSAFSRALDTEVFTGKGMECGLREISITKNYIGNLNVVPIYDVEEPKNIPSGYRRFQKGRKT